MQLPILCPWGRVRGGGGARRHGKRWGLKSNFPTLGMRFQFKVPHHQSGNFHPTEVENNYVLAFDKSFS